MASYVLGLLLAAAAAAAFLYIALGWASDASTRKGLTLQAASIESAMQFDARGVPTGLAGEQHAPWVYQSASEDLKYRVLDADGRLLLASEPGGRVLAPPGDVFHRDGAVFQLEMDGIPLNVLTVPLERGGRHYYIQAARSERLNTLLRRAITNPVLKTALTVTVVSLVILSLVVYFTLKRTLRPLRDASEAAARIAPTNLSRRLDTEELPSELRPLVDAFNLALDRLERGFKLQQEFLAGAAHELKTPLSLIRGQIELDGAADPATLLRDVDMMARQVHQLLHLAEVSEARNYVYEPIRLADVAAEVAGYLGRLAAMRQVSVEVVPGADDAPPLRADHSATFVLLKNLVENAIRHSPQGGLVTVSVDATGLHVQDQGRGIATEDLPRLFARFWRSADRRDDGAGLGLAICQQIADTHGWQVTAWNTTPGARFTVTFGPPREGVTAALAG